MKQNKLYKTAIYCRLSLDDGRDGDSSSIQTQKMLLEKYAKEHDFDIVDYYVDDGYSGLNYDRPNFQRLLNDIESKKIDLVITKDLSRLAGSLYPSMPMVSKGWMATNAFLRLRVI